MLKHVGEAEEKLKKSASRLVAAEQRAREAERQVSQRDEELVRMREEVRLLSKCLEQVGVVGVPQLRCVAKSGWVDEYVNDGVDEWP